MNDWKIFQKKSDPHDRVNALHGHLPPWRRFHDRKRPGAFGDTRGAKFEATDEMVEMVNAALYLRRPLLLTGKPGSGKSSLIYAVAWQLQLGDVLRWAVTSRSTLRDALYQYDALGRLHQQQLNRNRQTNIGDYIELGPLGTALLPSRRPRALLIDEIDKSDLDLPNDLLNVFEEGEYYIPELARLKSDKPVPVRAFGSSKTVTIKDGHVRCREFPFVVLTSNGEREFPAPFLRRCLRLTMPEVDDALLTRIVKAHLGDDIAQAAADMIGDFAKRAKGTALATDQLLSAVFLVTREGVTFDDPEEKKRVLAALQKELVAATPTGPSS